MGYAGISIRSGSQFSSDLESLPSKLSPGVFENIPSLVDEEVKVAVIRDTLRLMNPLKKKKEMQ